MGTELFNGRNRISIWSGAYNEQCWTTNSSSGGAPGRAFWRFESMDCDQGTWKTWRSFQLASFCAVGELEPHFIRGSGAGWACESKMPSQAWASGHLGIWNRPRPLTWNFSSKVSSRLTGPCLKWNTVANKNSAVSAVTNLCSHRTTPAPFTLMHLSRSFQGRKNGCRNLFDPWLTSYFNVIFYRCRSLWWAGILCGLVSSACFSNKLKFGTKRYCCLLWGLFAAECCICGNCKVKLLLSLFFWTNTKSHSVI